MLDWKKNEYKKNFIRIVLLGIVLRILLFLVLGTEKQSVWEYGIIAENIVEGKGYSFYYFESGKIIHDLKKDSTPSPSAYMAPGYVYILVLIKYISPPVLENFLAFFFNIIFYLITMFYLFKLTESIFNGKVALISVFIYTLVPEFIYTSYALGTTQIYHLFITAIVYYSLNKTKSNILILPIISGIALLFRFELFLLLIFVSVLMIYRRNLTQAFLIIVIPILLISPWIVRNYMVFDQFIPFSTTSGLNLFRGNNDVLIGGWHNFNTLEEISAFAGDTSKVEIFMNDMYKKEALNYLTKDLGVSCLNLFKKLLYYWFVNPIEDNALSPIYLIPWFLMLSLAIVGFIKSKGVPIIISLFILYHTILAVVFIPLLRYQTMMKIVLIPFVAFGIIELLRKDK